MKHATILDLDANREDMKTVGLLQNRESTDALARLEKCLSDHFDYNVHIVEKVPFFTLDFNNYVEFNITVNDEGYTVQIRLEPAFIY